MHSQVFAQGVTSASLSGKALDSKGSAIPGIIVIATHITSNTKYVAKTSSDGNYYINGLRVGGPYTLKASMMGMGEDIEEGVYLKLGSNNFNFKLGEKSNAIKEVVISAKNQALRSKTGSETFIGKEQISNMPTLSRSFNDFTRLTPEANLSSNSDGMSIGGQNNRMNSIYIDGAVNNDVFGLTEGGTNGASSGVSPFSMDAIESFNVQTAPFDVRQGGFAGGSINAVTRSGTNTIEGSVYMLYRNHDLAGTTPGVAENLRTKLENSVAQTYGVRVGLPLEKDKLFLFTNVEYTTENYQLPFNFSSYRGTSSQAQVNALANKLRALGYEPGDYLNNYRSLKNWKVISKLDWNISEKHKASFRYSYNQSESYNVENRRSSSTSLSFANNNVNRPNETHNLAFELNSTLRDNITNNLVFGYTNVVDDRGIVGNPFPQINIRDGVSTIYVGSDASSGINLLKQNIYTLTDNLSILKGKHNFTIGTHNEFYNIFNSFINRPYGNYEFNSLALFNSNANANRFRQGFSLVDNNNTDNTKAAADFNSMQLGLYGQDEFQVSDKLKLTVGLRFDLPFYLTATKTNSWVNDTFLPIVTAKGYDLAGAQSGQMPSTSVHISPRFGFNYDVKGDASTIIRGGTGVFTSRIPFVWIGGLYTNDGLTTGLIDNTTSKFNPNILSYSSTARQPSSIDIIEKDFKLPQFWKTNIALEQKLPWKLSATIEASFTKTLNNYMVENFYKNSTGTSSAAYPISREFFGSLINSNITGMQVIKNTGTGYAWNTSFVLNRSIRNGFSFNAGYTYGVSKVWTEPTSSINNSNWANMESKSNRNKLEESYSDFDMGHRFFGSVSYRKEYFKSMATTVSVFFNGQSGRRFSYTYNGNAIANDGASAGVDLLYVPNSLSEINLVSMTGADGKIYTAQQQWDALNAFITSNEYLSSKRGQYVDRNGDRLPFQFNMDLRLAQEFFVKIGKKKQSFEVTFDIFNFTNLLNNDWGKMFFLNNDVYSPIVVSGTGTTSPTFTFDPSRTYDPKSIDDSGVRSSRWQSQLGLRYNF